MKQRELGIFAVRLLWEFNLQHVEIANIIYSKWPDLWECHLGYLGKPTGERLETTY
jgi:hypothetical protein